MPWGDEPLLDSCGTDRHSEGHESNEMPHSWAQFFKEHSSDCLALLLGPAISVPFAACYAALVCQSTAMQPYFPIILQQIMWTQFVGAVLSLFMGQFVTTTNLDPLVAILFGQMAQRVAMVFSVDRALLFPNMLILMSLSTSLLGVALYVVGRFRFAFMLRFFPYTVIAGFLAGSGILILVESLTLAGGTNVWHLAYCTLWRTSANGCASGSALISQWVQVFSGILYAFLAGCAREAHVFGTPILLVICILASIGVKFLTASTWPPTSWFLSFPEPEDWWVPLERIAEAVTEFQPSRSVDVDKLVAFVAIMTVSWSINTLAIKKLVPLRRGLHRCDDQAEIQSLGLVNISLGLLGCHASMQSFKIPMMMKEVKAGNLWPWFNLAVSFTLVLTSPRVIIQTVPRFLFAGTVIRLASDLIIDWLIEARARIAFNEWCILAMTAVAIAANVSMGIIFGLFLTLVLFAIEYSGVTGVVKSGSLRMAHSSVVRGREEQAILHRHGNSVQIRWLSGYLFFGSVTKAVDEVWETLSAGDSDVAIIVLDFSMVPSMDASGVYAVIDLIEEVKSSQWQVRIVLCGFVRRLDLALRNAAEHKGVHADMFHNLDGALESCENQLLATRSSPGVLTDHWIQTTCKIDSCGNIAGIVEKLDKQQSHSFRTLWSQLFKSELQDLDPDGLSTQALQAVVELRVVPAGEIIFKRGEPAMELLILSSGAIEVTQPPSMTSNGAHMNLPRHHLNEQKGDTFVFEEQSTRQARCGSIFGAVEYIANCRAMADQCQDLPWSLPMQTTGIAVDRVSIFVISFDALRRIERSQTVVALVLRTWLSHLSLDALLAHRVSQDSPPLRAWSRSYSL